MKTRVKLYTHRIKNTTNGQLYDVFEIRTPYTTPPRSVRRNDQKSITKPTTLPTNTTTTTTTTAAAAAAAAAAASSTDPSAITKAFDITSTKQAYAPNYKQACMFLRAMQINRRERLSPECLRKCHFKFDKKNL